MGLAVRVGEYSIALDSKDPEANLHFVSHAHSDHTAGVRKTHKILCSAITKDLVEQRIKYSLDMAEMPKQASMFNSGHMFGSRQLLIKSDSGNDIVYTGDYQMQKSPAAEEVEVRHADILIMDSTYPYVGVTFDEKEEVIGAIQSYVKDKSRYGSVLFGAYAMGKAQELVRICNEVGISPLVDSSIDRMNKVYVKHGMKLDYATRDICAGVEESDFSESVWIVNMNSMDKVRQYVSNLNNQIFTAVATGFAKTLKFNTDVQFALSDHADFRQAVDYIDRCNPKIVYTCGSSCDAFAKNLKAHGYNAAPLKLTSDIASMLVNYV